MIIGDTQDSDSHIDFAELKLRPGTWLQLQSMDGVPRKSAVEFAAALRRKSIFVAMGEAVPGVIPIKPGERYLVRGFNGTREFTFTTEVLEIQTKPFIHAHLKYPDSVESKVVREALRVSAALPVMVVIEGVSRPVTASVKDLSVAGALIESATPLGMVGDRIEIRLSTRFESRETELVIPAVIRYQDKPEPASICRSGLEFSEVPLNDKLVLYYLLFTLSENVR